MTIGRRISTAFKALRGFEDYDDQKYLDYLGMGPLKSGVSINEITGLKLSAVFAAVNLYASVFASIPKQIKRRLPGGGSVTAYDHPLYDRLHTKPNDSEMSAWNWIYSQIVHKFMWGNWYTWVRGSSYRNRELIPLLPDRTELDKENPNRYITTLNKKKTYVPADRVLHIPHFTLNGTNGRGVIHYARESLGIAMALDQFAATFFGQGLHAGGIVEVDGGTGPEEKKRLQTDFNKKYSGLGKFFRVIFLSNAKYTPDITDPEKAQALESRQFSVVEVARWMNLPPHMLRDLTRATYSNIEEQEIELVVYSFMPLATQIENAMNIAFFDDEERREYYVNFELKGLLRGDIKARTEFYTAMVDRGIFNADNVLELEDMNPQPDGLGQIYLVPLNMIDKRQLGDLDGPTIVHTVPLLEDSRVQQVRKQLRSSNAIIARRRVSKRYRPLIKKRAAAVVTKEIDGIRSAAEELLGTRASVDLAVWLDQFYEDLLKVVSSELTPVIGEFAGEIKTISLEELESELDVSVEFERFLINYLESLTKRYIVGSKRELKALLNELEEKITAGEEVDIPQEVESKLSQWEETKASAVADSEVVKARNAFAIATWAPAGVSKIRWDAYGESCPFCVSLDGTVVGISTFFLPADVAFQPEGALSALTPSTNIGNPPAHGACDCDLSPDFS